MVETEDSDMEDELIKEEGQTQVKEYKSRKKRADEEELAKYESETSKAAFESDIHEEEREKGRELTEKLREDELAEYEATKANESAEAEYGEPKEESKQKWLEGMKKAWDEAAPEKKELARKAYEGAKKTVEGGTKIAKNVGTSIGKAYDKYKEYKAKEPERIQSAIAVEKSKIQLAQERQKLELLRAQQQNKTPGFAGTGLGGGALPFSGDFGVGISGKSEGKPQMIREKVTTYVRGRPVTTERWVPVKGAVGRKNIPTEQQELYARELQKAQVFEEHLPFGGQHNVIGQESQRAAPFTGEHRIMGGQQQQQVPFSGNFGIARQRQPTRVIQKQQPAPFSGNYGVPKRQPTRVIKSNRGVQQPQGRQVIINIQETPFGGINNQRQGKAQVNRRKSPPIQQKSNQPMPFGGFGLGKAKKSKKGWF